LHAALETGDDRTGEAGTNCSTRSHLQLTNLPLGMPAVTVVSDGRRRHVTTRVYMDDRVRLRLILPYNFVVQ
jgi:hypothetical protein